MSDIIEELSVMRRSDTLFQPESLPIWSKWNVSSQVFTDGSGRVMEVGNDQGNLLRFIYSNMHDTLYLQWIGYSDNVMSELKKLTNWSSIFWSVEAYNKNKHDAVACTFNADNIHLLDRSLALVENEKLPSEDARMQISMFLSDCRSKIQNHQYYLKNGIM